MVRRHQPLERAGEGNEQQAGGGGQDDDLEIDARPLLQGIRVEVTGEDLDVVPRRVAAVQAENRDVPVELDGAAPVLLGEPVAEVLVAVRISSPVPTNSSSAAS